MTATNVGFHSQIGRTVGMRFISVIRIALLSVILVEHTD
jgi:hypothetical protein